MVVRLDESNEATFKQLIIEEGKQYLKALNPDWPNRIIEVDEEATICGVIVFKGEGFGTAPDCSESKLEESQPGAKSQVIVVGDIRSRPVTLLLSTLIPT